jgi:hypothetical protein
MHIQKKKKYLSLSVFVGLSAIAVTAKTSPPTENLV